MKKQFLYITFTLLLFGMGSCKKSFLDNDPSDQIRAEKVFENINNVRVSLNGIYRLLYMQYSTQEQDGHPAIMIVMDYMGEDMVHTATGTPYFRGAYRGSDHRNEGLDLPLFAWRMYYRVLANVNLLLDGLDTVPDATQADKDAVRGECLALRAFAHFMLVQLYAIRYDNGDGVSTSNSQDGIPLMLTYAQSPQPRASVEKVYIQINKDIDDAIGLLDGTPARGIYRTRIDKSVAMGLKARIALTQQHWADAAYYAKEARKNYTLMSNAAYLDGFTDMKNVEWMWGVHQLPEQVPTYGSFYAYMSANFNSANTRPNPKLINAVLYDRLTGTDVRKKLFCNNINDYVNYPGVVNASTGQPDPYQVRKRLMHKKFVVADPGVSAGDIPYMRAAEMYLIEAEALNELGGHDTEALDVIKELAANRDPSFDPASVDVANLKDFIDIQRRTELWGEGFRFLDLKRKNKPLERTTAQGHTTALAGTTLTRNAGITWWQFKIPLRELQANSLIKQNP